MPTIIISQEAYDRLRSRQRPGRPPLELAERLSADTLEIEVDERTHRNIEMLADLDGVQVCDVILKACETDERTIHPETP